MLQGEGGEPAGASGWGPCFSTVVWGWRQGFELNENLENRKTLPCEQLGFIYFTES